MRLTNICGFETIDEYVQYKLGKMSEENKTFSTLFKYMFSESDNIMAEISDGYRIKKITYGEFKEQTVSKARALSDIVKLSRGDIVGIYMDNSMDWIRIFWSVLICGYKPLLMNKRLPHDVLCTVLEEYNVRAVISDGEKFPVNTITSVDIPDGSDTEISLEDFGDEVIFMSSGTTQNIKLCAYTAENFYYQLGNSVDIVKKCPEIAVHYEGEIKQLTLLPFYHVFGFIAVYLWFGFFSRTFVFLNDMNPQTIQNTVKKHKVTHIFAVPLVWDAVYKAAMRTVKKRGEHTYKKLCRAIRLSNNNAFARKALRKSLGEVRENLFGDSICFLISGGGHISNEVLEFYNGIGYHIANGYGMTEVGITSVETSSKASVRNLGSIGVPFKYTQYSVNESGQLLIKGKNMASRIYQGGMDFPTDFEAWFNSCDLVTNDGHGYYINGRSDDLIVSESGENLNPQIIENSIKLEGAESICLFSHDGEPTLIISSKTCYSKEKTQRLINDAREAIMSLGLAGEIHEIYVTPDPLMSKEEFKISRKRIANRYKNGELTLINEGSLEEKTEMLTDGVCSDIQRIFAEILQKDPADINPDAHFFGALGGTSIDYFMLANMIEDEYGIDVKIADGSSLYTVNEICNHLKGN